MDANLVRDKLVEKGLKVTPQRIAILEAIYTLNNHPSAEMIMESIRDRFPGIASGTIYKVLDVLIESRLVDRVKTDKDIMRYDGILEKHHHLYISDSEEIRDYENNELDQLLREYFNKHAIKDFEIEGIRQQISGKFLKPGSSS
jgi:Fur family peroxide stress response transcriptional regulator